MFRRWDGSSWVDVKALKRWNGSSWQDCDTLKRWNGSSWIDVWQRRLVLPMTEAVWGQDTQKVYYRDDHIELGNWERSDTYSAIRTRQSIDFSKYKTLYLRVRVSQHEGADSDLRVLGRSPQYPSRVWLRIDKYNEHLRDVEKIYHYDISSWPPAIEELGFSNDTNYCHRDDDGDRYAATIKIYEVILI